MKKRRFILESDEQSCKALSSVGIKTSTESNSIIIYPENFEQESSMKKICKAVLDPESIDAGNEWMEE